MTRMKRMPLAIRIKRAYDPPEPTDGFRVLIDRLWPRGIRKEDARLDLWAKDIAPSPALRQWYQRDPAKFAEMRNRYRRELEQNRPAVDALLAAVQGDTLTLVYASRDTEHNHANVLREFLEKL